MTKLMEEAAVTETHSLSLSALGITLPTCSMEELGQNNLVLRALEGASAFAASVSLSVIQGNGT